MADNVLVPLTGSGDATANVRTDDVGGVQYPVSKLDAGGDGVSVPIVAGQQTMAASLPVAIASNQTAVPISGSVTASGTVAATQSGTWTVQPGNTANTTAWKVDGSAVTQPVSAASLPLPALAATSTKQSDGSQKTQIVDGSGNVIAATSNALNVAITSGGSGGGPATIADGADVAEGATTDAAVAAGAAGTVNAHLRSISRDLVANVSLAASSAVIGHVIADSGSTTAVTQGTATNLKAQAEAYQGGTAVGSGNPLQVTLANTGANATAVKVDGSAATQPVSGTVTVQQSTASSLKATVVGAGAAGTADAGVLTVQGIASMTPVQVSQATAGNLNATVTGSGSAGTAATGVITVQGIASMTKLLVTPDANSAVNVAQINGVTPLMGNGATGTGALRVSIANDSTGIVALTTGSSLVGYVGQKNTYTNTTTLTTTNFSNLASGSGWQSVAIASSAYRDIHFLWVTKGAAGSTATVDFYIAETLGANGTTYVDGATGTEGTYTASGRKNARFLGSLQLNTTTAVQGAMKLSDVYAVIPPNFAIIAINNSGGTISATGGDTVFAWAGVN